jgi:hypothetical protein
MLPDDVLLIIFAFYVGATRSTNGWPTLAHVCRKWRDTVFGSPRHLNLQLIHTEKKAVKKTLDVWPPFLPIVVDYSSQMGEDNLTAILEHRDRLCEIKLNYLSWSAWDNVFAAMQVPFPALTCICFTGSNVPGSFLGGSAPRLQRLALDNTLYPGLLRLSAPDLVELTLSDIPRRWYISPEEMATSLSMMARLKKFVLKFKLPFTHLVPWEKNRCPPPPTRILLPSLTYFWFCGEREYLADFVTWVDTPLLNRLDLPFSHEDMFDTPEFAQFISRTPKLRTLDKARISFYEYDVVIRLGTSDQCFLSVGILGSRLDSQLASLTKVYSSSPFPQYLINIVESLYLGGNWSDDIDFSKYPELFHPFTAVKDLYLSRVFVPRFAAFFQDLVGEGVTQVLPALQQLFVEELHPSGSDQKAFEPFIAARRQLSGHTVAVSHWDTSGKMYF